MMDEVKIIPIKTRLIREGDDAIKIIVDSIPVKPRNKDVIVVATKPLLKAYSKTVDISKINIEVSDSARKIASEYKLHPILSELIIRYTSGIYGGVDGFVLANIDGILLPNGGIDHKNIGKETYALPYVFIKDKAREIYNYIRDKYGVAVGVVISDSTLYPLRLGTRAVAVVIYGFTPVVRYTGNLDLYGEKIKVTYLNIADELASAAHLVMGEGAEGVPATLIRGLDIKMVEEYTCDRAKLGPNQCIYNKLYNIK